MPNFTTTKEEMEPTSSQNASSVISQWEKLPELRQEDELLQEDEPDESFSEMKPSKAAMMQENNTTPVRKVVGQLKSELELRLEEAKKPQTWANAVKNEKPVVIINPNDTCPPTKPDQPESPEKNSDNKENEESSTSAIIILLLSLLWSFKTSALTAMKIKAEEKDKAVCFGPRNVEEFPTWRITWPP